MRRGSWLTSGCLGLPYQVRNIASGGTDTQERAHHEVEAHRSVCGFNRGDARLARAQVLRERACVSPRRSRSWRTPVASATPCCRRRSRNLGGMSALRIIVAYVRGSWLSATALMELRDVLPDTCGARIDLCQRTSFSSRRFDCRARSAHGSPLSCCPASKKPMRRLPQRGQTSSCGAPATLRLGGWRPFRGAPPELRS